MNWAVLFFYLLVAHFVCDFSLQGETTAKEKSPFSTSALQKIIPWPWWLTAHAFMHAGAVMLITQHLGLALIELFAHWLIDYGKVLGKYSFLADQFLHLTCKYIYIVVLFT